MTKTSRSLHVAGVILLAALPARVRAAPPEIVLPSWFEDHRVQAHFENSIQDDLQGLFRQLHPAIRSMGSHVLTRIFKTTAEGAWWPTAAGYTNELLGGRDLGLEIARDAHQNDLKVIAYYRIMCDDFVEREHPEWLCRDTAGNLVLEPRTRRRRNAKDRKHVICFNSPARDLVKTRLLELADRGVDAIYFDSWHMPEVCTCRNCQQAFREETGRTMNIKAARGSADYRRNAEFIGRSIVRNFREWKQAVKEKHSSIIFAISSSLYPCFDRQMQITAELLGISDTSKTEFSKPFGGVLGWPLDEAGLKIARRRRPYLDQSFALPSYDLQNALGWSLTRDSCNGRPPLMWIPFTRTEQEALFSTAAAVSYGCIASIHPTGLWTRRMSSPDQSAAAKYRACYELGDRVSPHLASARPLRFALIHVSARSRNDRIADPRSLWVEFFAPILGAFETLKEEHWPVATVNDLQLDDKISPETRVLILPHANELSTSQQSTIDAFESAGGTVVRLNSDGGWHLSARKPRLKQQLMARVTAGVKEPPIRARGPAAMHAVFYQHAATGKQVVCLVNDFGWYRSEREPSRPGNAQAAPAKCSGVVVEFDAAASGWQAFEALTGKQLTVRHIGSRAVVDVPDFPIAACIVAKRTSE